MINCLQSYIAALDEAGELHRVTTEVDSKFELCHVSKVNEEAKGPALLYENVKDHDIPVFTSAFTTPKRLAIALEQDQSLSRRELPPEPPYNPLIARWLQRFSAARVLY